MSVPFGEAALAVLRRLPDRSGPHDDGAVLGSFRRRQRPRSGG